MTAETRVGSTFGCWGDNVVYGYILIRILQTKQVERWEGGRCGPAPHYSVSTEDSDKAAQSARVSCIVTKKGGLCCYLEYLVYSS